MSQTVLKPSSKNDDLPRVFLQNILKKKYVTAENAIEFCAKFSNIPYDITTLKRLIGKINDKISSQDLFIKLQRQEITGETYVVLVSTLDNTICKFPSIFNKNEVKFFYRTVKEIMELSDDHKISVMYFLNLTNGLNVNKDRAEELLMNWVNEGYFINSDDKISFGPRFILEFAPQFSNVWKDFIKKCTLCTEVVFMGRTCASCKARVHFDCFSKYYQTQRKCPNCKIDWIETEEQTDSEKESNISTEEDDEPMQKKQKTII